MKAQWRLTISPSQVGCIVISCDVSSLGGGESPYVASGMGVWGGHHGKILPANTIAPGGTH